jgi:hypothetical protein
MKCIFLDKFLENTEILNFMEIRPVGAELLRVEGGDRQTDSRFFYFANEPNNNTHNHYQLSEAMVGPNYSI